MDSSHSPGFAAVRSSQSGGGSFVDGQGVAERVVSQVQNNGGVKIFYISSVLISVPVKVTYGEQPQCCGTHHPGIRRLYPSLERDRNLLFLVLSIATKAGD
jgi:hypothetical protein